MRGFLFLALMSASFAVEADKIISSNVVWSGNVEINEEVRVRKSASLKITVGSKVLFKENSRLICEGRFEAKGALFEAESPMTGKYRMEFSNDFNCKNCEFKNVATEKKRFHDAFLRVFGGKTIIKNCKFINCSAIEIVRNNESLIKGNSFVSPIGIGAAIFLSSNSEIRNNEFKGGDKTSIGLRLNNAENCRIQENRFSGKNTGIDIYGKSRKNKIIANSFFDSRFAVVFHRDSSDNLLLCCLIDHAKYAGIRVLGGTDNIIRNCVIWNASFGVLLSKFKNTELPPSSIQIENSVIAHCNAEIIFGDKMYSGKISHNLFWDNKKEIKKPVPGFQVENNIRKNPLFATPERGNFRPQTRNFGYEADSPLIGNGAPKGTSIGLYPKINQDKPSEDIM